MFLMHSSTLVDCAVLCTKKQHKRKNIVIVFKIAERIILVELVSKYKQSVCLQRHMNEMQQDNRTKMT